MARSLTPDAPRATIAVAAMIAVLLVPGALVQVAVIVATALIGLAWLRTAVEVDPEPDLPGVPVPRWAAIGSLALFVIGLAGLPLLAALLGPAAPGSGAVRLIDVFYRAGALVFGGGHVVLPLLQAETVGTGLVDQSAFLAGYGAAQAVPGPLFTFAAYLGAVATEPPSGVLGATLALVAVFVPAALLVVGVLPFWARLRHVPAARRALAGVNAGVVGLLAAALYSPVFTEGVTSVRALAVAVAAFVALTTWRAPAWAVVLVAGLAGWLIL